MPRPKKEDLLKWSVEDLRRLAATVEKTEKLQVRKAKLEKELAGIEAAIQKLVSGVAGRPARKKKAKKRGRKKVAMKVARKKTGKKSLRKKAAKKARPKKTLEDVLVSLLKGKKKGMAFQNILATIQKKKLYATKSKNFANVLRRTLSTSKKVKRVGRGVYASG